MAAAVGHAGAVTTSHAGTLVHLIGLDGWLAGDGAIVPAAGDRFVHCSPDDATALAVANSRYRDAAGQLVALTVDPAVLDVPVRWEPPDPRPPAGVAAGTVFPHVYGVIDRAAVTAVRYLRRDAAGRYTAVVARPATAQRLGLLPHPEGGWYRQTWVAPAAEPAGYPGARARGIDFLLGPGESSAWQVAGSDEVWLWHRGGPLTLTLAGTGDGGGAADVTLGPEPAAGQVPRAVVPGGVWRRAYPASGVEVLVSRVVSPWFDVADLRT